MPDLASRVGSSLGRGAPWLPWVAAICAGLVLAATDTGQLGRSQAFALAGAGMIAVLLLVPASRWLGPRVRTVARRIGQWRVAAVLGMVAIVAGVSVAGGGLVVHLKNMGARPSLIEQLVANDSLLTATRYAALIALSFIAVSIVARASRGDYLADAGPLKTRETERLASRYQMRALEATRIARELLAQAKAADERLGVVATERDVLRAELLRLQSTGVQIEVNLDLSNGGADSVPDE